MSYGGVSSGVLHHSKLHKSSLRHSRECQLEIRPPRPPCWQDFIDKSQSSDSKLSSKLSMPSSIDTDGKKVKSNGSLPKKHKKISRIGASTASDQPSRNFLRGKSSISHSKLKRTQSEPCISDTEFPSDSYLSKHMLAHGSKQKAVQEARRYLQDTYIKCTEWLAQISPCTPPCPVEDNLDHCCSQIDSFVDEFSSFEISTEDNNSEQKRYSLDRIPEWINDTCLILSLSLSVVLSMLWFCVHQEIL